MNVYSKCLVAAPLCVVLLGASLHARASDFEDAMDYYDSGHYVLAADRFRAAAGHGNARAQEILGFMYSLGRRLSFMSFSAALA